MASFTRVSVDEMKFTPAHVEIVRGTSVRWEQSPKCMVRHCLEVVDPEENNQASSPALLPGEPWEHTFEACGDFHYRSLVYCFMKGTIKVVDAASSETRARGGAKGADAPVETATVPLDAGDASASAAKAFRSRASSPRETEKTRAANSVVHPSREPGAARFDDADASEGVSSSSSGRSIDHDPPSFIGSDDEPRPFDGTFERKTSPTTSPSEETANDPKAEDFFPSCDRCARAFVSSTNLQRHRASHDRRGSGKNKGKGKNKIGSSRRPKPPPASAEEIAAFFEGLSDDKKREALRSVAEPGSAGALVVCGVRARRDPHEPLTRSHAAADESRRAAYVSAGAAVARMVDALDAKDGGDAGTKTKKNASLSFSALFDALVGASEGTCFGPRADLDLSTMCLDDNLDAALAYCVEQRLVALYLEERSVEAEAARKLLLAEIDESRAEEERRAARRAEARARKKTNEANDRSARAKSLRESEAEEQKEGAEPVSSGAETREEAVTTETKAIASAARRDETRKKPSDDDASEETVAGEKNASLPTPSPFFPARKKGDDTENRREHTPDPTVAERSRADGARRRTETADESVTPREDQSRTTGRRKSRGPDFRGDSAKGGGATPTPPTPPSPPASLPRTRAVDERRDSIATARPTPTPPSPLPPPNPPSLLAASTPRAVPAPRRTGIQSRTSPATSAAASGVSRDFCAIVKPLREPTPVRDGARDGVTKDIAAREPPRHAGDFKNTVTHQNNPRKSRRALKAERAEARAKGLNNNGCAFGSATDFESASGSDFERKTVSDTEFGVLRRGGVLRDVKVALTSRDAEGTETSTRRARAAARAAEKTPRADGGDAAPVVVADGRTVAPPSRSDVPAPTRPLVDDSFASPTRTSAKLSVRELAATPVAIFASPPSAARAIPVAPVWTPERETARMHPPHAPPAFAPSTFSAVGAAGPIAPGGMMPLGHFPSILHPMHPPPPGVDMEVYMHHYATALAAIQASPYGQIVAARPGPATFAPPLPPGPPPRSSRVREDF